MDDKRSIVPSQSTLRLSVMDRMLSRMVRSDDGTFVNAEGGQALNDLMSDLFFHMWKNEPVQVEPEDLPVTRAANAAVIDLIRELGTWEEAKRFTTGSIAGSLTTAELTWHHIMTDNLFRKLLDKQQQLEQQQQMGEQAREKQQQFEQVAENLDEQGDDDMAERAKDEAQQAQQQAQHHDDIAEQIAQELMQMAEQMGANPFAQASMQQAGQEAAEAAEEVAEAEGMFKGWSDEQGSGHKVNQEELEAYLETLKSHKDLVQQIASVIGRVKEVAMRAGEFATKEVIATAADVAPTQDLMSVFPDELAYLSNHSPDILRASKVAEFAEEGLLGWIPKLDRKRRGAFTGALDASGSMRGKRFTIGASLCLAIADLARQEGRRYNLEQFGSYHEPGRYRLEDSEGWKEHFTWATSMDGGGTDYGLALDILMENVTRLRKQGVIGVDALFISDGECALSDEKREEWLKFKEDNDVRLLYIAVAAGYGSIEGLADKALSFYELDLDATDSVAKILGEWLTD